MMKAKTVFEFHKTGDPLSSLDVGANSSQMQKEKLNSLANKGVNLNLNWDISGDEMKRILKKINKIVNFCEKLNDLGVPYNQQEISNSKAVCIKCWKINKSGTITAHCLTKEDAIKTVIFLHGMILGSKYEGELKIEYEDWTQYLYYDLPEVQEWLDNIENFRKKIQHI